MVIIHLKCGHKILLTKNDAKRVKIGHMAYCLVCQDLRQVVGKT
jgi:hypothetical protein